MHSFTHSLERITNEYNSLLTKRAGMFSDANDFPPLTQENLISMIRHFIGLRMALIADPNKPCLKVVGEKDPAHIENLPVMKALYPDAKIIHIIRDGRAVVVSAWHNNLKNNTPGVKEAGFDKFMNEAARQWGLILQRAIKDSPILGDRYLEVRYEDLVQDAFPHLMRILKHLGVDCSEEIVRACIDAASFENLSKGRSQGQEDAKSFFRKGIADDWKNYMTTAQIQRFNARSGGMLEELGYLG